MSNEETRRADVLAWAEKRTENPDEFVQFSGNMTLLAQTLMEQERELALAELESMRSCAIYHQDEAERLREALEQLERMIMPYDPRYVIIDQALKGAEDGQAREEVVSVGKPDQSCRLYEDSNGEDGSDNYSDRGSESLNLRDTDSPTPLKPLELEALPRGISEFAKITGSRPDEMGGALWVIVDAINNNSNRIKGRDAEIAQQIDALTERTEKIVQAVLMSLGQHKAVQQGMAMWGTGDFERVAKELREMKGGE